MESPFYVHAGLIDLNSAVIQELVENPEPAVRVLVLMGVLDYPENDPQVWAAKAQLLSGPWINKLLGGQQSDGGFGVHPYQKWTGAHWRLVSLVELGIPAHEPRAVAASDQVLRWLMGESHRQRIKQINGRTRRCASQEGNALAVCCRLGLAADPRVQLLADSLLEWQWPDGGWNCDKRPEVSHSSFYESLAPLWGLIEYHRVTGDPTVLAAARRASELFLHHKLFRSYQTGEIIDPDWLRLHYPLYWHVDILQILLVLSRLDALDDPRCQEALDILESKRRPDGFWTVEKTFWKLSEKLTSGVEVLDWGRSGPNTMITLNALCVLKSAGRLSNQI